MDDDDIQFPYAVVRELEDPDDFNFVTGRFEAFTYGPKEGQPFERGPSDVAAGVALAWARERCRRVVVQVAARDESSAGVEAIPGLPVCEVDPVDLGYRRRTPHPRGDDAWGMRATLDALPLSTDADDLVAAVHQTLASAGVTDVAVNSTGQELTIDFVACGAELRAALRFADDALTNALASVDRRDLAFAIEVL